ncbi:MAG: adenine phosphoribosyltransferase [Candidatus Synechococcus spongiarum SP3]|uniref:Adenine phosphoribosyltransferase n=1 Tax=Candidatus Synechococcus spongiarum SP3 TaxID=1604020 RepID=A0A0G2IVE6_9SYNE|nr:MAG: adenine phosphoribosyltransferase [Candidatus Synechococcus spongiarum SP3]
MSASPPSVADLLQLVRTVPDFPKPGIAFRDLTPLFADPAALRTLVDELVDRCRPMACEAIVGIEARGFLVGPPMACAMGVGFVPARKPGKLPRPTYGVDYALEYGMDRMEVHREDVQPGQAVLIVDDLLATGGTAAACATLVETAGARVCGYGFVAELRSLAGRQRLRKGVACESLVVYD